MRVSDPTRAPQLQRMDRLREKFVGARFDALDAILQVAAGR